VALLGLVALAVTSTDGMVRRLGGRNWQRLHRIVYVIGVLAVVHFFLQSKADEWEPTMMAGFYLWLMGWRALAWAWPGEHLAVWRALGLSVVAAVATAVGEAVYFWLAMGVDPMRVLAVDFSLDTGVRPAWIVAGAGAAITVTAALRVVVKRAKAWRPRPA
jgi:methionine sulfoxide reductase heme-binding subunit